MKQAVQFTARFATWRVRVVLFRTRTAMLAALPVHRHCYGAYRSQRLNGHRILGTLYFPLSTVDHGHIAHEAVHVLYDWMKVRRFNAAQAQRVEETGARWVGRLTRRCVREVLKEASR